MGVKNLWRLLLPISRRISIPSLSHQTLAIDASIWLTQISKACRDPETGRLLPNRPHVRIFLLRLMRLLFHEIKPVVVFDGVMPEVKRREIERRRNRREKLWREDEDGGGGALKRTAKKILVQRLREIKRMESKSKELADGEDGQKESGTTRKKGARDAIHSGAFAAGFVPADVDAEVKIPQQSDSSKQRQDDESKNESIESKDEIISIYSDKKDDHSDTNSENDWESSHAVQASIQNSITQPHSEYSSQQHEPTLGQTNEEIAALPSLTRSQYMESQFRERRIQSRRECIDVAADMEKYSEVQVKNFLMGSRLNQRMGEIGKLAGKIAENSNGENRSEVIEAKTSSAESNRHVSMEVLFGEKDDDLSNDGGSSDDDQSGGGFLLPSSSQKVPEAKSTELQNVSDEVMFEEIDVCEAHAEKKYLVENDTIQSAQSQSFNHATTSERKNEPEQSKLFELVSAGDEWATWGEESEGETKQEAKQIDSSLLETRSVHEDSSSDEEGGTTFLTLSAASKQPFSDDNRGNVLQPNNTDTSASSEVSNPINYDSEHNSVDWDDGDSNSEPSNQCSAANELNNTTINDDNQPKINDAGVQLDDQKFAESNSTPLLLQNNIASDWSKTGQDCGCIGESSDTHSMLDQEKISQNAVQKESENSSKKEDIIDIQSDGGLDLHDGSDQIQPRNEDFSGSYRNDHVTMDEGEGVVSENIAYLNEFDACEPENPNIAALQHAQETASRLTNWAGRAVQRAFASHLGQKEQEQSQIDKSSSEIFIESQNDREDDNILSNGPTPEKMNVPSPENDNDHQRAEFLDTTIEGLNAAHHAILEEEKLMERDMSTITDEMKEDILKLLQLCGIPWIESPSEAEAQCAALEELGLVDGVVTEDSDIFVFGGKKVYKNFFNEQQYVEAYYAIDARKELGLGKNELISLAMLLGGDYTDGVKGVGIVNGMEILQAFPVNDIEKGLSEFRHWLDGFGDDPVLPENDEIETTYLSKRKQFHKKHKSARTRWVAPPDFPSQSIINAYKKPVVDKSDGKFTWAKPNIEGLRQFCAESIGWNEEETERVVLPVLTVLKNKSKQRRLESYFMRYEDGIKFAEVRSKRLRAVLEDVQDVDNEESNAIQDKLVAENASKKKKTG